MVATNQSHEPGAREPAPGAPSKTEPTAQQAALRVARLFPEVYRRYHYGQHLRGGAELPVTRRSLDVLRHLAASGPLTVGEQAAHMGLRRNSVSELLQRLEAKGLVARIRDERDERRVLVWLTDAGRDVVARVGEVLAPDALEQAMTALAPDERAAVIRGFELLVALEPTHHTARPQQGPSAERTQR
jgi:DNA-binding MarR family transcriptional regulator